MAVPIVNLAEDGWRTIETLSIIRSFLQYREASDDKEMVFCLEMDRDVWDKIHNATKWPPNSKRYDKRYSFNRMRLIVDRIRKGDLPQYLKGVLPLTPIYTSKKTTFHQWTVNEWLSMFVDFRKFRDQNIGLGDTFNPENHCYEMINIFQTVLKKHSTLTLAKCFGKMCQSMRDFASEYGSHSFSLHPFEDAIRYAAKHKLFKTFHPSLVAHGLCGASDAKPPPNSRSNAKRPAPPKFEKEEEEFLTVSKKPCPQPQDDESALLLLNMNGSNGRIIDLTDAILGPDSDVETPTSGLTHSHVIETGGDFSAMLVAHQRKRIDWLTEEHKKKLEEVELRHTQQRAEMQQSICDLTEQVKSLKQELEQTRAAPPRATASHSETMPTNAKNFFSMFHVMSPNGVLVEKKIMIAKHTRSVLTTKLSPTEVYANKSRHVLSPIYVQSPTDMAKLIPFFYEVNMEKLLTMDADAKLEKRPLWVIE